MSSKQVLQLRSAIHPSEGVPRKYVDKFEMIGTISQFYSEDSVMALVNVYRNIWQELEKDFREGRIDPTEYHKQKTQIEREMDNLNRM